MGDWERRDARRGATRDSGDKAEGIAPGKRTLLTPQQGNAPPSSPGKRTLTETLDHRPATHSRPAAQVADATVAAAGGNGAVRQDAAPPDLGNYDSSTGKHVARIRTWKDADISARRLELQHRLALEPDQKLRSTLLEEYSAIEWVAKERNLPLAADANANPRDRYWTPDNAPDMRRMLEREMATSGGYADGKRHAETRINMSTRDRSARSNAIYQTGTEQTALMDRDVSAFRSLFQGEAKRDALVMLDQSTIAIDTVLHRYGLPGGSFRMKTAAQHVAHDPGALDAETEKWVSLATRADDHQAAFAHGHDDRESLAREADKLRGLQASIEALHREQLRLIPLAQHARHEHPEGRQQPKQPDMTPPPTFVGHQAPATGAPPPFKSVSMSSHDGPPAQQLEDVRASLEVRRLQFQAAWIQAERKHPIFAAYRGGKGADATKLAGLGGNDETVTRSVIKQVLPKLGNIYRTKAALEGAWGTLDPLRLAPVVEITKQRLFVPQGSPRERAVHDMVEHAHDGHGGLVQWALEA